MAFGAANVTKKDAVHLSLAGNTVSRRSGARTQSHVARTFLRLLAGAMQLPQAIILSTIAINAIPLAFALALLIVFDSALSEANYLALIVLAAGLICAVVAEMRLRLFRDRLLGDFAGRECLEAQLHAARRLLNSSGSTAMRLLPVTPGASIFAIGELSRFHSTHARLALLELPFIALYLLAMAFIGGVIVVVPIILTVLYVLWTLYSYTVLKPTVCELTNQDRERFDFYSQNIKALSTVKALAIEPQLQRRLERIIRDGASPSYKHILLNSRQALAGQSFETLIFLSLLTVGSLIAAKDMISIGEVAASSLIGLLVAQSVRRILGLRDQIEAGHAAITNSETIANLPDQATAETDMSAPAKIQLNGLCMAHDGCAEKTQGINLTVGPGEVIGLIINDDHQRQAMADMLRCRITPDSGEFLIDGQKITAEQDSSLRRVMFVDDKPTIFRGSVTQNISLFGSVNPAAAIELAQRLGVEAEIQILPDDYSTRLDPDRTAGLSRDLLIALSLVRIAAIRPRLLIIDAHRFVPSGIGMHACKRMIEELRGSTTVIILSGARTGLNGNGRNYKVTNWSLEPVDPGIPYADEKSDRQEGGE